MGTSLESPITQIAFPLLLERSGILTQVPGTGVIIGSNLAITARHVLEDIGVGRDGFDRPGMLDPEVQLSGYLILDPNGTTMRFRVTRVWSLEGVDLAVLLISAEAGFENHVWAVPRIEIAPPTHGDGVSGFGYPRTMVEPPRGRSITVRLDASTTTGRVVEVYPEKRDRVAMPYPCFETNMRCDRGMSGGPVMNERGHLCGIFSRAFDLDSSEPGHTTYVSLLWPLLGTLVDYSWPERFATGQRFPLIEAARAGTIRVLNLDSVEVVTTPPSTSTIRLRPR